MFRLFSLFIAITATIAQAQDTTGQFFIQVLFNEGAESGPHSQCTQADFELVINTLADIDTAGRRGLKGRALTTNCPKACCGYKYGWCAVARCAGYPTPSSNKEGRCRRRLESGESTPLEMGFEFVDEEDPKYYNSNDGGRDLQTYHLTIEECNAERALLLQHLLQILPDITTNCINLLLSPIQMRCIVSTD